MPTAQTPPALTLSVAAGAVGVLLLLVGAVTSTNAFFFAALASGSLSLAAALYWRGELIAAWREKKRG